MDKSGRTLRCAALVLMIAAIGVSRMAVAAPQPSASDFGGIGLLQMPTARFADDGRLTGGVSWVDPYTQGLLGLQWFPWLETQLRYVDIRNRQYGPEDFSGDQSYKDRGVDFKLRIAEEGELQPAMAVGIIDVGGSGVFASEYWVASKRFWDWDFTLGLGWGRMSTRGGMRNPLISISHSFDSRGTNEAGEVSSSRYFRGPEVAVFGGLQWQFAPTLGLKLEYDSNNYDEEALDNPQVVHFPLNAALNWRLWDAADLSVGVERGDTLMLRLVAFADVANQSGPPKRFDPPPTPVYVQSGAAKLQRAEQLDEGFYAVLATELERQQITLVAIDRDDERGLLSVWYSQDFTRDPTRAIGRVAQTLAELAPEMYDAFTVIDVLADQETSRVTLLRREIVRAAEGRGSAEEMRATSVIDMPADPKDASSWSQADWIAPREWPAWSWSTGPGLRQHIGGPDGFYFGQLWWRLGGSVELNPHWSASAVIGANVVNNFDELEVRDTSELPHVRSDITRYLKEGNDNLARLETNFIWPISAAWTARLSAGIFEEMYGGVATELLYAPPYSPAALGIDINRVRQRDYDQRLDFLDYEVTTGHVTGYFKLPYWGLQMNVSVGRYLAGDWGGTLEIARRYRSGVTVGLFATRTDVSPEEFGEGSFDKGLFIELPLDLFSMRSSQHGATLVFKPLTRDGGQRVRDGIPLYGRRDGQVLDAGASWSGALN
jgi:hypothetical protein